MSNVYDVHTDGSCLDNGKPSARGGWAFIVTPKDSTIELHSDTGKLRVGRQTNIRAEMEGMCHAFKWISQQPTDHTFRIISDSQVVIEGVNGLAKRTNNRDIWIDIEHLAIMSAGRVDVCDVEGHNTESTEPHHVMNNKVDAMARKSANSLLIKPVEPILKEESVCQ